MKSAPFILLLILSCCTKLVGQLQFGNEWINYSQEYYKIKITQEGIYRISYSTLVNSGLPEGQLLIPKNSNCLISARNSPFLFQVKKIRPSTKEIILNFMGRKTTGVQTSPYIERQKNNRTHFLVCTPIPMPIFLHGIAQCMAND